MTAIQSTINKGAKAYTAGEDLIQDRRVKLKSATTADPPQVQYADAGEACIGITLESCSSGDFISVRPINDSGTFFCEAAEAFAIDATLYGATDGRVQDTSSGTAYFKAMQAANAASDVVEIQPFPTVSTTAASVSIADGDGHTSESTVEAALAEIYAHIDTAQAFIPVSLTELREVSSGDVANTAGNGGVLASDTTPILEAINGVTDGCQRLNWATSDSDAVMLQKPLPPDLNTSADIVLHFRASSDGTNNPELNIASWFNEGDTKVEDATAAISVATYTEYTATIAAADVPAGAQILTSIITPATHAQDALYLTGVWIEYTRKLVS